MPTARKPLIACKCLHYKPSVARLLGAGALLLHVTSARADECVLKEAGLENTGFYPVCIFPLCL